MNKKSQREAIRAELLRHIAPEFAVMSETRAAIALLSDRLLATKEPKFSVETIPFGELEFLKEEGVDVEQEENLRVRITRDKVAPFVTMYRAKPPGKDDAHKILRFLQELLLALQTPRVAKSQAIFGWETLAEACRIVVQVKGMPKSTISFVCKVLTIIFTSTKDDSDSTYDEHGNWGGPAPHVPAAAAAMFLFPDYASAAAVKTVLLAAKDEFRPARTQVALFLTRLSQTNLELMWKLAEVIARDDPSPRVVQAFVAQSLPRFYWLDEARADSLLDAVYTRLDGESKDWEIVANGCQSVYLWRALLGSGHANEIIDGLLSKRQSKPDDIKHLLFELRSHLRRPQPTRPDLLGRAFRLLHRTAAMFAQDLRALEKLAIGPNPGEDEKSQLEATLKNLQELASEIYFASNAFTLHQNPRATPTKDDVQFLDKALPAIRELTSIPISGVVHQLLETLNYFLDVRAETLFPLISKLIITGKRGAYQIEPMGADLAVRILERYLAEHRIAIEGSVENRRSLIQCLDVFAAWPKAVRLVYRFEELFR